MIGTTSTGQFKITNGQIIDANGDAPTASGLSVYDAGADLNRLNFYSYLTPNIYAAFVQAMASKGTVAGPGGYAGSERSNADAGSGPLPPAAESAGGMNQHAATTGAPLIPSLQPGSIWPPTPPGSAFSALMPTPTPSPTPIVTPSANDTVVIPGSVAPIVDAIGNKWTITAGGQVAINGAADSATAEVKELAYVNGQVWEENASQLWRSKATPAGSWSPNAGSTTSPLQPSMTIASTQTAATVTLGNATITAAAGDHMVFILGTGDTASLSGGTDTIADHGGSNTYVIPPAGKGYDAFTTNVLTMNDTIDLRPALAATQWNGSASTLSRFLSVTDTAQGAVLSISPRSGGMGAGVACFSGATAASLTSILDHAIT